MNDNNDLKIESVEDFIARGGRVQQFVEGDSYKRKTRKTQKIDVFGLLNAARGTDQEKEVIAFLKSQGVKNIT